MNDKELTETMIRNTKIMELNRLRSENAELKCKEISVYPDLLDEVKKLRSENEEYKKNLMRERFLIRERDLWIQRWADLEKWIKNEIEIYCKCAKWDSDEDLLKDALESVTKKMHELESGGEISTSGMKGGHADNARLEDQPKPASKKVKA